MEHHGRPPCLYPRRKTQRYIRLICTFAAKGEAMAIKTLDEFLATIPDDDNRSRMVDVPVSVALTYPELELRRIA